MPAAPTPSTGDPGGTRHWPSELRLRRAERCLEIAFEDGARFSLPAEFLRVESPSAEVRGHGARDHKRIVPGCRQVTMTSVEPVGNYAVRLVFDDGHDSGLYSWTTLYELGRHQDKLWAEYLARLAAHGLSRDP
jgi:DUF971 family protein